MTVIGNEKRTIRAMVELFCQGNHGRTLCLECGELLKYANHRLDHCRFGERKPTCAACPAHCYGPRMRERVRRVMRYAGPRMTFRHPVLALRHLWREKVVRPRSHPA